MIPFPFTVYDLQDHTLYSLSGESYKVVSEKNLVVLKKNKGGRSWETVYKNFRKEFEEEILPWVYEDSGVKIIEIDKIVS